MANSLDQGEAAGISNPESQKFKSMVVMKIGETKVKCLVDTGAGPSCISEELMQCNPFCKNLTIKKCDRKAYSVSGAPVVTLGTVTTEFKLAEKFSYVHEFTILRGLIHPVLLGLDFLTKYNAVIQFDHMPNISLRHPVHKYVNVGFMQPPAKVKEPNHVALLKEIEIPPLSVYYADAYHTNFEEIGSLQPTKANRLLGIAAVQKTDDTFDPGVIMRDAVISADEETFKVEVMNPSNFALKLQADTPLGAVFDYDCEIIETGQQQEELWTEPAERESDIFLRQQTLTIAAIRVEETDPEVVKDPQCWPQNRPPSEPSRDDDVTDVKAAMSVDDTKAEKDPLEWPQNRPPSCGFTKAYSEGEPELKFVHELKEGEEPSKEERTFMIDLTKVEGTDEQKKKLEETIRKHPGAFAKNERDLGCTDLVYHYAKVTKERPVHLSYHKAQGTEIRKVIEDQTDNMMANGVIKESQSPYCSPIVMARKKNGGWRYCVDLRKINEITEKVTFPVPKIEDALRRLKSPTVFSTLDLLKAYYQIPVAEEDQKYYAFSDGRKHLQFARCPMGAKNSGSTLALLMELVLRGLPPECVLGYLDDILIATEDFDTHVEILERLLTSLEKANLKLCPGKCDFVRKEVKTLGYTLSAEGIRPDDYNLDKIRQWTKCDDKKGVRTFLGLTGYYRTHVKRYAHKAAPISELVKNETDWKWEAKEQAAFDQLKDHLLNEPIAAYPDYDREFILKTDASKVAMGAVLTQKGDDGKERMVACVSKKFSENELKWIPYDREYWALVYAVRHFSHYLRFKKFTLITDHKPLLNWRDITSQRDASNRRVRWAMELATYEMDLIFKEGKRHADADALSRHPDPDEPDAEDEDDDFISTLSGEDDENIWFVSTAHAMEINLVEINTNEAVVKEMRDGQARDDDIRKAVQLVTDQNRDLAAWKDIHGWYRHNRYDLAVSQGVLYHTRKLKGFIEPVARTVIPTEKRLEMLFRCHGHMQSGHPSATRALTRIEKFAAWPNMAKDMKDYVQRCVECQAARDPVPRKVSRIHPQDATRPLEYVQADMYYVGKSHSGNSYVLVMEDRATKHCKLYAVPDTKAPTVGKCLESYVSQLGCPETWGTDGGKEFFDRLITAMCSVFGIKKEFALAYRPQTQGQTERKNRTIKGEILKRSHQFGRDWPSMLKWIEFAYNTTTHPSQKYSPFVMMFGREARLPVEQDIPHINTGGWQTSMRTYFEDFLDRIAFMREDAAMNKAIYKAKMSESHDKNILPPLEEHTEVLRSIPKKLLGKTDMPKDGPWEVVEQREKEGKTLPVYVVKDDRGNVLYTHRETLTPFLQPRLEEATTREGTPSNQPRLEEAPAQKETGTKPKKRVATQERATDGPASRTRSRKRAILSTIAHDEPETAVTSRDDTEEDESGSESGDDGDDDAGGHNGSEDEETTPSSSGGEEESEPEKERPDSEDDIDVFHDTLEEDREDLYREPGAAADYSSSEETEGYRGPGPPGERPVEGTSAGEGARREPLEVSQANESDVSGAQSAYRTAESSLLDVAYRTAESSIREDAGETPAEPYPQGKSPKTPLFDLFGQNTVPRSLIAKEHSSGSTFAEAAVATTMGRDDVFSPISVDSGREAPCNTPSSAANSDRESLTEAVAEATGEEPSEGTIRRTLRSSRQTEWYRAPK